LHDGIVFLNSNGLISLFVVLLFLVVFFDERNGDLVDIVVVVEVKEDFLCNEVFADLQDDDANDLFDDDENESSLALYFEIK
jgi:hypothetical protein